MTSSVQHTGRTYQDTTAKDYARVQYGDNYYTLSGASERLALGLDGLPAAPASRSETTPRPFSTVPFPRDPDYVHREQIVSEIRRKLSVPGARVALVGLGGVGKSQLAIEYAHQVREDSPKTWVFWLHASSAARLEQGVRETLERLKVLGRDDAKANVFQLFRSWLRDDEERKWLIILDNADDVRVLLETPLTIGQTETEGRTRESRQAERFLDYLPWCGHGSMLITTRTELAALKMTERRNIVNIETMAREHALALLGNKLRGQQNSGDLAKLATELDFMPLAMTQAAAYISQRGARSSLSDYLEKLQGNSESKLSMLEHDVTDLRRDREATNSIFSTWKISFEHIRSTRRSAADLLSLMSCFDRQAISEALLKNRSMRPTSGQVHVSKQDRRRKRDVLRAFVGRSNKHAASGAELHQDVSDNVDRSTTRNKDNLSQDVNALSLAQSEEFEKDLVMLRAYSFISITTDPATFEMHRLVQVATQRWLDSHGWLKRWQSQFINNLDLAFPCADFENWEMCRWLFPHATRALDIRLTDRDARLQQASLLNESAWYAKEQGNYGKARQMAVQSMKTRKRLLGSEHPHTLTSMDTLASTYRAQGQNEQAAELGEQVLEISKRVLGPEHLLTLNGTSHLALTYRYLGRYDEAAELQEQVFEMQKRVLGPEHPHTLINMSNLASTYADQRRYDKAEEMEEQVLETNQKVLGLEHPDMLISMSNLAMTKRDLGQKDLALDLLMRSAEISSKVLGSSHPYALQRRRWAAAWAEGFDYAEDYIEAKGEASLDEAMRKMALSWTKTTPSETQ